MQEIVLYGKMGTIFGKNRALFNSDIFFHKIEVILCMECKVLIFQN